MDAEIAIRYEGLDGDAHEIDLYQLGESLQGFARVLAVCGNLVTTGKYNKQFGALAVRVLAKEPPKHNCYEVVAVVQAVVATKEFWSGTAAALLLPVVQFVFGRRKQEEMKLLKDALDKSLASNAKTTDRLIETINRMADALRPGIRRALEPIGRSVKEINLYQGGDGVVRLDASDKDRFSSDPQSQFESTKEYTAVISEMDMVNGTCKVSLDDSENRLSAVITDPVRSTANNPYALAMAQKEPITFLAKAEVDSDGNLVKLYISDLS